MHPPARASPPPGPTTSRRVSTPAPTEVSDNWSCCRRRALAWSCRGGPTEIPCKLLLWVSGCTARMKVDLVVLQEHACFMCGTRLQGRHQMLRQPGLGQSLPRAAAARHRLIVRPGLTLAGLVRSVSSGIAAVPALASCAMCAVVGPAGPQHGLLTPSPSIIFFGLVINSTGASAACTYAPRLK